VDIALPFAVTKYMVFCELMATPPVFEPNDWMFFIFPEDPSGIRRNCESDGELRKRYFPAGSVVKDVIDPLRVPVYPVMVIRVIAPESSLYL
jgi:hypothetical protein